VDHGALALLELEPDAERLDDQQDVGEEDRRVDGETLDGLQRDLGRGVRRLAELEEAVPRAHRAVLGQVAAGLAHEPHGCVRDGFPPRGAEQRCIWR